MSQARLAWGAFKNMMRQAARDPLWAFVALLAAPFRIWKPLLGLLFLLVIVLFVVGFGGQVGRWRFDVDDISCTVCPANTGSPGLGVSSAPEASAASQSSWKRHN